MHATNHIKSVVWLTSMNTFLVQFYFIFRNGEKILYEIDWSILMKYSNFCNWTFVEKSNKIIGSHPPPCMKKKCLYKKVGKNFKEL